MEEDRESIQLEGQHPSSLRREFTLRGVARQVAVNFMPSRQPHSTLRHRRLNPEHDAVLEEATLEQAPADTEERRADLIVREMEQRQHLMEDDPGAEELRREALRDLPQGLTMKRHVRAKLSASVSLRSKRKPISMFKRLKYRISFAWKRGQDRFRDFIFSIELWYEAIRNIEGNFGSAVGSYFYFLRWLFACDLLLLTFVVSFVCVPQALYNGGRNETRTGWGFLQFLSGKGAYEDSLLFYGHYHAGQVTPQSALSYHMPFAYFFTMFCLYITVLAVLCYRTSYSYRKNFIETAGGLSHVFANKVFCGWDFGVVSQRAAALTANSIHNELKELLNEQNKKKTTATFWVKFGQHLANATITLVILATIVCLEYGLWQLLLIEGAKIWAALVSLLVTFVLVVAPAVFSLVVRLEFYSPRTALYVTLARTWLLDVGTLTLLLYYWTQSGTACWETSFGQEAYRLILYDSLISLIILPIFEFVRGLIYKQNSDSPAPEFNIAYNSLTLIYNQAVLWFGMLFSPLLVAAVTIKFLLLFYVKRECALRACQPARKIWRASQTQTVLYMLVTLSLFTTLFAFGSLFLKMSSQNCGPFREYKHVYEVLSEGVLNLSSNERALGVILFVTRPGVIAFVMLILSVAVYYMRAKARAQQSMVDILRHMLVLQAKDKEFLLAAISKVSNGEWLYSPKPEEGAGAGSHTWRYLHEVRKPSNAGFHFDVSRLNHSHDRPASFVKDKRGSQYAEGRDDGDTDSSFSWQGSSSHLNRTDLEGGKWS